MQGRSVRKLKPISVKPGTPPSQLLGMFRQAPCSAGSLLDPSTQFLAARADGVGELTEMDTNILMDDCESSALLAKLAKKTSLSLMRRQRGGYDHNQVRASLSRGAGKVALSPFGQLLKEECSGWPIFKNYTDSSWSFMADIVQRGNLMLSQGHVKVMGTIGLASTASAGENGDVSSSLNGHCFNVGLIQTPSMSAPECEILEGTAETIFLDVTQTSPRMNVKLMTSPTTFQMQTFDFPRFLTLFGGTVEHLLRVMNCPNGGFDDMESGWPHETPVTGWVGKTMVLNGLRSDANVTPQFYNRILYTGWSCNPEGQGCMPVQELGKIVTGCGPCDLNNVDLRGVSADISPDELAAIADVMEETTPPMVSPKVFQTLSEYWVPCQPLEAINVQSKGDQVPGVDFIRIAVMETPAVPEFIKLILEAKGPVIKRANELNAALPDSDGITGSVCALGTGVHVLLDVPYRANRLTYIDSLKRALYDLSWPVQPQAVPGGIHHT